jgi:hypothetical protein
MTPLSKQLPDSHSAPCVGDRRLVSVASRLHNDLPEDGCDSSRYFEINQTIPIVDPGRVESLTQ